ncbi:MAG: DUF6597 domain-containing transcriptional factor [Candidatus Saccharibacteria bacterium]
MNQKLTSTKGILASTSTGHYTLKRYEPSKDLAHFIECFWIVRWDLKDGESFDTEILPFPNVNIAITSDTQEVTGIVTGKFTYTLRGNGTVLGVMFKPGGFYPFYRKPIDRLTNQTVKLGTLFSVTRLRRVLAELSASDEVLVEAAEKLLRTKKPERDPNIDAIESIIQYIQDNKDVRTVQAVSEHYEISERTMQHVFQQYVGIGLKWIISRYRLQDIAEAIHAGKTDWAAMAQEYGFTDQSHFIRDFKKVLGETPTQYAQRVASISK